MRRKFFSGSFLDRESGRKSFDFINLSIRRRTGASRAEGQRECSADAAAAAACCRCAGTLFSGAWAAWAARGRSRVHSPPSSPSSCRGARPAAHRNTRHATTCQEVRTPVRLIFSAT